MIRFQHVSKSYPQYSHTLKGVKSAFFSLRETIRGFRKGRFQALEEISFEIKAGESVGIIGSNGSGKSTLLGLIAGVLSPQSGIKEVEGRVCALLELGAGFHPDLSGRENIILNAVLLGLSRQEVESRLDYIIAFSELDEVVLQQPIRTYSSGMLARLGFSVAVHLDPEILLIDEILAVGDLHFQSKCWGKIQEFKTRGITIVLVSHSTSEIRNLCDRVIWLDHGKLVADGGPKEVVSRYEAKALEIDMGFSQKPVPGEATVRADLSEQRERIEMPVTIRTPFALTTDSVLGKLMGHALFSEAPPLTRERVNAICTELYERLSHEDIVGLSQETLSIQLPDGLRQIKVDVLNNQLLGVQGEFGKFGKGYEPEIGVLLDRLVPEEGILFDVGASWGIFSLYLASSDKFRGTVYAFEPGPRPFKDLQRIVGLCRLDERIKCCNLAVGDYDGTGVLSQELWVGNASLVPARGGDQVQVARLDSLDLPSPHVMKLDVEGFEGEVLRGAEQIITKSQPAIIFEHWLKGGLGRVEAPFEALEPMDYDFYFPGWNVEGKLASLPGESDNQVLCLVPFRYEHRADLPLRINVLAWPRSRSLSVFHNNG